jgi:perosamine synthetase
MAALLREDGIDTRPFFIPVHSLPPYHQDAAGQGCDLPVTDRLGSTGINLPTYVGLADASIDRIASAIRRYARR